MIQSAIIVVFYSIYQWLNSISNNVSGNTKTNDEISGKFIVLSSIKLDQTV